MAVLTACRSATVGHGVVFGGTAPALIGMGVPAVVSAPFDLNDIRSGTLAILNGSSGTFNVGPTLHELEVARREQDRESQGAIPEELADAQAALALGELTRAEYERMAGPLAGEPAGEG